MNSKIPVITIDGPSGSGKGTISQLLAEKLQFHFLDSGALYRVLAHYVTEQAIDISNIPALAETAASLPVEFQMHDPSSASTILLHGKDVTRDIRTEQCGMTASKISIYPDVRQALLNRQHQFQEMPGLVADGRDMGTVVFPDAPVKFFLTASLEERAKRRYHQLKESSEKISFEQVLDELTERDVRDKERTISPTKPAADAIIIDTTGLSIQEVLLKVLADVERIFG